jgi:hypothetical protein
MMYSVALGLLLLSAPWVKHPVIRHNLTSECWIQAFAGCSPGAQLVSDAWRVKLISLWTMTSCRLNLTVPSALSDWTYGRCVSRAPERVSPGCPLDKRCVGYAEDQMAVCWELNILARQLVFSPIRARQIICNRIIVIVWIWYFSGSVFSTLEY